MGMKKAKKVRSVFWYIGAIFISLITVYPFLWMIATSFKPEMEIYSKSLALFSENFSLQNYKKAFDVIPFGRYFLNSFYLAGMGVLTNVFLGALAGYSFAKLKFRGRKVTFSLLLSSMMIPGVITMIPQFLVLKNFPLVGGNNIFGQGGQGLINHYAAIILPGAVGAYAVFFMKQFFETLPDELAEAARVDGCSEFRIFWNIYLPLILPAAVTLGIMTFQSGWNSFMWPMIVLMAGTVISVLPTLLLFLFAQKYYIQGIAFSGSKD